MHPASLLNFFTIGIGPSSSHTVGPMKAALAFVEGLTSHAPGARLRCELFGSLAATGRGHHTDRAIVLGFLGYTPASVPVAEIATLLTTVEEEQIITLPSGGKVAFDPRSDLVFHRGKSLPLHPNGMHFLLLDQDDIPIEETISYSLGGGFIASEAQLGAQFLQDTTPIPFPYRTAAELLILCKEHDLSIAEITLTNENCYQEESETRAYLDQVWQAMQESVRIGCEATGTLPGALKVKRRAPALYAKLQAESDSDDPLQILDWVNLFALAVNEENASGGRIVTAPTNGAAGIIPAVLLYAVRFRSSPHRHPEHVFLLTAAAIANLYKTNASLSGADVGCQGEVGVACSMAAGALTAYLGGTPAQVENAAEIGMEHNLGLTCDPIGGLVQIPCIERNAMASVKAINASRMALGSFEDHHISLDKVIATMLQTGRDMMAKYKETSRGGLAVNYTEC